MAWRLNACGIAQNDLHSEGIYQCCIKAICLSITTLRGRSIISRPIQKEANTSCLRVCFSKYRIKIITIELAWREKPRQQLIELLTKNDCKRKHTMICRFDDWYVLKIMFSCLNRIKQG